MACHTPYGVADGTLRIGTAHALCGCHPPYHVDNPVHLSLTTN